MERRTINEQGVQSFTTLDVYLAAWIILKRNIHPRLIINDGRVSFSFPLSEALTSALRAYSAGETIEAVWYVNTIKSLKGQIFSMKQGQRNG